MAISVVCVASGAPWNASYSSSFSASGGTGPYTYAITTGSLPTGLTLNGSTGVVTGTPTVVGIYPYTVTATDSLAATGTANCSIQVSFSLLPIDLSQFSKIRMSWSNGQLYLLYQDTGGLQQALVFDPRRQGWKWFRWAINCNYVYLDESPEAFKEILLMQDGHAYPVGGFSDNGSAIAASVYTPIKEEPNPRVIKQFGDELLDCDPQGISTLMVQPAFFDLPFAGSTTLTPVTVGSGQTGRALYPIDLQSGRGILAGGAQLFLFWSSSSAAPVIYETQFWATEKTDVSKLRSTDWNNVEFDGDKFVQGAVIRADTGGTTRSIQVLSDGGTVATTLSINHLGEIEKPYSFTPFFSHLLKVLPTDSNSWLLYSIRWVYEPAPELTDHWITAPDCMGLRGWGHINDAYIPIWGSGSGTASLVVTVDGTALPTQNLSITSGFQKVYVTFPATKGLTYQWSLTSSIGFRVYLRDVEIRIKSWGSTGPYEVIKPFGDVDQPVSARI